MTTNTDTPREGGADWESGAAADAVTAAAEAWRLTPTDANLAAWNKAIRDMNAAVGSRATQSLSNLQAPLLASMERIGASVEASIKRLEDTWERRFDYMLGVVDGHLKQMDKRLDVYGAQIDRITADTEQLKAGQAAYNGRLEEMDVRHGAQLEEIAATVEHIRERLAMDEARLDKKRLELDQMHQEIARINEYIASSRRRELDDVKARLSVIEQRLEGRGDGDK